MSRTIRLPTVTAEQDVCTKLSVLQAQCKTMPAFIARTLAPGDWFLMYSTEMTQSPQALLRSVQLAACSSTFPSLGRQSPAKLSSH